MILGKAPTSSQRNCSAVSDPLFLRPSLIWPLAYPEYKQPHAVHTKSECFRDDLLVFQLNYDVFLSWFSFSYLNIPCIWTRQKELPRGSRKSEGSLYMNAADGLFSALIWATVPVASGSDQLMHTHTI